MQTGKTTLLSVFFVLFDEKKKENKSVLDPVISVAVLSMSIVPSYFFFFFFIAVPLGVSMFDPTREHDTNPTRVFSG